MEEPTPNTPHVQAKFFTKQSQHSVPDSAFSVPANVGIKELSALINSLLQKGEDDDQVSFDFLIEGEFLRVSLQQHMENRNISTETVVEIEYIEQHPAPRPVDSLLHDDWVSCVHAAGQHIISGCYDNTVILWELPGSCLLTIPGHSAPVKCVSWLKTENAENSRKFVTGSHDQTALIWQWNKDTNSVECLNMCRGHAGSVDCVAVDSKGAKFCTGSWDKMLKIWSAEQSADQGADADTQSQKRKKTDTAKVPTKVPLMTLSGHKEGVSSALWMDDGEVCTSSWDHTIKFWDLIQGANKSTINGSKVYLDVACSPKCGLLVAASSDRHVRMYDPRITDGAVVKCTFTSHTAWVSSVSWSQTHEHQFISGSYDGLLKLWDTRSPKAPLYDMSGHEDKILAADWSIPEYMLSGGADNHLKIFKYSDKVGNS